ncbi:MAG: hypothetical protein ABII18_05630, partial [bacterium]
GLPLIADGGDSGISLANLVNGLKPDSKTGTIVTEGLAKRLICPHTRRAVVDVKDVLLRLHPDDVRQTEGLGFINWHRRAMPENVVRHAMWDDFTGWYKNGIEVLEHPHHDVGTINANIEAPRFPSSFLYHYMTTDLAHTVGYLMSMPLSFFTDQTGLTEFTPQVLYMSVLNMMRASGMLPEGLRADIEGVMTQTTITNKLASLWEGEWLHIGMGTDHPQYMAAHDLTRNAIPQMSLPFVHEPRSTMHDHSSFYLGGLHLRALEVHIKNVLDPQVVIWVAPFQTMNGNGGTTSKPHFALKGSLLDLWKALEQRFNRPQ